MSFNLYMLPPLLYVSQLLANLPDLPMSDLRKVPDVTFNLKRMKAKSIMHLIYQKDPPL